MKKKEFDLITNIETINLVEAIIFRIPHSSEGSISLRELTENIDESSDFLALFKPFLFGILKSLEVFGALDISDKDSEIEIFAVSERAQAFIRSFILYYKYGINVIEEWHQNMGPEKGFWSLPFVMDMEERRIQYMSTFGKKPEFTREISTTFAVIKAQKFGKDVYLLEYNRYWKAYNFLGGRLEARDNNSYREAIIREIEEEARTSRRKFNVMALPINIVKSSDISKVRGAYSSYSCKFFQAFFQEAIPNIAETQWFTEEEIYLGVGNNGENFMINERYLNALKYALPGGLAGLPVSVNQFDDKVLLPRDPDKLKPVKVLFLASNPKNSSRLRLDEEVRNIKAALDSSEFRDKFEIVQCWAVKVTDIQSHLLRYKPDIVHFSGHGSSSNEIILEDERGNCHPVSTRALSRLFSILNKNIRCIVLNACYSQEQAIEMSKYIDCVIGMSKSIGDAAAISFSEAFYQALGYGESVDTAFKLGCNQVDLAGLDEQDTPNLLSPKTNPMDIVLIDNP